MAKTRSLLRPRLGLIGGQHEHQPRLDVSVVAADMRVIGRMHTTSVVTVAGTVLGVISADDRPGGG